MSTHIFFNSYTHVYYKIEKQIYICFKVLLTGAFRKLVETKSIIFVLKI